MNIDRAFEIGMFQHREEIEAFAQWLSNRAQIKNVLEIGGLHGGTAALWHSISTGHVVSIDLPNGRFGGFDHHLDFLKCTERNKKIQAEFPRFAGVLGDSHAPDTYVLAQSLVGPEGFDLLFIDGDHTYEGVRQDFEMYSVLVNVGGVIAFHDINDTEFHHNAGCYVDKLWRELKDLSESVEFTEHREWGGIGALVVR